MTPRCKRAWPTFIANLLAIPSFEKACQSAGVSESTAYRWLRDPEFQTELAASKRRLNEHVTNGLRATGLKAVSTLRDIMADTDAPAYSRVSPQMRC